MNIDRRQFVKLTFVITGAAVTGAGGVLAACSSDDPATPPTPTKDAATGADTSTAKAEGGTDAAAGKDTGGGGVYACRASISQNHGHVIEVPTTDLDSTTAKTYSIKGTSPHTHNVVLDPDDLAALKSGISVKKTSNANGETHDHEVNILCATI